MGNFPEDRDGQATLLIVDDEELVRWSLRERFSREGYTVVEQALRPQASSTPWVDSVLLHFRLPDGRRRRCTYQGILVLDIGHSDDRVLDGRKTPWMRCVTGPTII